MGKTLSRPSTSSVGNGNNFKIAKWYSLGIKSKKRATESKIMELVFHPKNPRGFFFPFIKYLSKER